ncbi:Probable helicase MAGATAMA 3 [Eumeta japonica]|uniref:Probable helicase MAGATAMA 3 n=1 Tax=Eumeta variegata TaxID=151549 RepID=A0A4C1XPL4_EUMVA|nr:Probable helicase MAGATAMA 3 [Eumeta japonica]
MVKSNNDNSVIDKNQVKENNFKTLKPGNVDERNLKRPLCVDIKQEETLIPCKQPCVRESVIDLVSDSDDDVSFEPNISSNVKLEIEYNEESKHGITAIPINDDIAIYDNVKQELDDEVIMVDSDDNGDANLWLSRLSQSQCSELYDDELIDENTTNTTINKVHPDENEVFLNDIIILPLKPNIPQTDNLIPSGTVNNEDPKSSNETSKRLGSSKERNRMDRDTRRTKLIDAISNTTKPSCKEPKTKSLKRNSKKCTEDIKKTPSKNEERKKRLREIATKSKVKNTEHTTPTICSTNDGSKKKVNVKVTAESRGAFLTEKNDSKPNNKAKNRSTSAKTLKNETSSKADIIKNGDKTNIKIVTKDKNIINQISDHVISDTKPTTLDKSKSKKKTVRFSTAKPKIIEFQIEPGNKLINVKHHKPKYEYSIDRGRHSSSITSLERQYIMRILKWNTNWLKEKTLINNNQLPDLTGGNVVPSHIFHNFSNHAEYVKQIGHLLLIDIWDTLASEYDPTSNQENMLEFRIESVSPPNKCTDSHVTICVNLSLPKKFVKNMPKLRDLMLLTVRPGVGKFFYVHEITPLSAPPRKSSVICSIIMQYFYGNSEKRLKNRGKILICATSNAAVDGLVGRLLNIRQTLSQEVDGIFGKDGNDSGGYEPSENSSDNEDEVVFKPEVDLESENNVDYFQATTSNANDSERFRLVRVGRDEVMHDNARSVSLKSLAERTMSTSRVDPATCRNNDVLEEPAPYDNSMSVENDNYFTNFQKITHNVNIQRRRQELNSNRMLHNLHHMSSSRHAFKLQHTHVPHDDSGVGCRQMLRDGGCIVASLLYQLFNKCWKSGRVPNVWCKAIIVPFNKEKGSRQLNYLITKENMWRSDLATTEDPARRAYCQSRLEPIIRRQQQLKTASETGCMHRSLTAYEKQIVQKADIIATTLTSVANCRIQWLKGLVTLCIVDEAGQAIEPVSLIPLTLDVTRLALIGDPQQLPGFTRSEVAKEYGLGESLFSRLSSCGMTWPDGGPTMLLDVQYRMHPEIADYPNRAFYAGKIQNKYTPRSDLNLPPYKVLFITSSESEHGSAQTINDKEAWAVTRLVTSLYFMLQPKKMSLAVITPYVAQKELIKYKLRITLNVNDGELPVEVNTVDSFQGQERDVVVVSLTRRHGVGFLHDAGRMNVMLTRAKHSLLICIDPNALQDNKQWKTLIDDAKKRKLYRYLPEHLSRSTTPQKGTDRRCIALFEKRKNLATRF